MGQSVKQGQMVNVLISFCVACGKSEFSFVRWLGSDTGAYRCNNCGHEIKIKSAVVGETKLPLVDMTLLEQIASRPPMKTTQAQRDKAAKNRPTKDKGFVKINFRLLPGQRDVIKQMIAVYKRMTGATGKAYYGTALERACAEAITSWQGKAASNVDYSRIFTRQGIDKIKGRELDNVLAFTFLKNISAMFSDEAAKRDWVLQNVPDEYRNIKPAKAVIRRTGADPDEIELDEEKEIPPSIDEQEDAEEKEAEESVKGDDDDDDSEE